MSLNQPHWNPASLRSLSPTGAQSSPNRGPSINGKSENRGSPRTRAASPTPAKAFTEVWCLKLNEPTRQRALWLRFAVLTSQNGFKRVAETWAVFCQRNTGKDPTKVVVKQSHDVRAFTIPDSESISIGDCTWSETETRGFIQSKGQAIQWDLKMRPREKIQFEMLPSSLSKTPLGHYSFATVNGDLSFFGEVQVNGETFRVDGVPGMQSHHFGPRNGHSWIWGHGNLFNDEQGRPVPFVFEGVTARGRLFGPVPTPRLSSFFFMYQGKPFYFNSLRDLIRLKSTQSLNEWKFQADRGELSFRGQARAEHKDFVGLTFEDTDGSLIYSANSQLSDLKIQVYRRGKLETSLRADGTAGLEIASRHRNPYVPLLI